MKKYINPITIKEPLYFALGALFLLTALAIAADRVKADDMIRRIISNVYDSVPTGVNSNKSDISIDASNTGEGEHGTTESNLSVTTDDSHPQITNGDGSINIETKSDEDDDSTTRIESHTSNNDSQKSNMTIHTDDDTKVTKNPDDSGATIETGSSKVQFNISTNSDDDSVRSHQRLNVDSDSSQDKDTKTRIRIRHSSD